MKFRMHRGGFDESMLTACEIEPTKDAVEQMLRQHMFNVQEPLDVRVRVYVDAPDRRNGWERTHLVTMRGNAVAFTDSALRL